jgi:intracellular sulfur oxidation DsrE/DsrF family protein
MRNMLLRSAVIMAASASIAMPAVAQPNATPLIPGYGKVAPVEHPGEMPDPAMDYKVVLSVTKAGEAGSPPPQLDQAARLANLLSQSGVDAAHRHIVVIFHGPATLAVLNAAAATERLHGVNPSADLISKLTKAGISVHVCGQALAAAKIAQADVLPDVQVDLSALTTLSILQLKGYALLPD